MVLASWVALLGGALLAGLGPVAAMYWPSDREGLGIVVALFAAGVSAAGLVGIAVLAGRVDEAIVAGFLGVASALGGFALGGALLGQLGEEPPLAQLPPEVPDSGDARPYVILLSEAEPDRYDPASVSRTLRRLADAGVPLPPEPMRAFIYASEKARYRLTSEARGRQVVSAVASQLAETLGDEVQGVEIAWTDDRPTLDHVLAGLVRRGGRKVVVAVHACADDAALAEAKRRADATRPQAAGVEIAYAEPLWSSVKLAEMVAERVATALDGTRPLRVGVALLGHGQGDVLELDAVRTEQETYFAQRIRALLVEQGLDETHVRLGWMQEDPEATEVVRHLAALGCRTILVVPVAMPVDDRETLLDVREAVVAARVEGTAEVRVLPAWGEDPTVAAALADCVREAMAELSAR